MSIISYLPFVMVVAAFGLRIWLGRGASKLAIVETRRTGVATAERPLTGWVRPAQSQTPECGHFVTA